MTITNLKLDDLHHACVIYGNQATHEQVVREIKVLFEGEDTSISLFARSFESLGIDVARTLNRMQSAKKDQHEYQFFVIHTQSITHEAQNALLKVLEDPTERTHFMLVVPKTLQLLPTVISRVEVIEITEESDNKVDSDLETQVSQFIEASLKKRLSQADKIAKKDSQSIERFVNHLEKALYENKKNSIIIENSQALQVVLESRTHLLQRGGSARQVLERIAIALQ